MTGPFPAFIDQIRDALLHAYDLGHLQTHPLLAFVVDAVERPATGPRLRRALLDAIEAVRPGPDVAPTSRAWRLHHILELRYIECHDVAEVMEQVALSSAQYHREHQRALQMIAVILWEQWQVGAHWPAITGEPAGGGGAGTDLVRQEAEGLVHDRRAGRVDLAAVVQDLRLLLQPLCTERAVDLAFEVEAPLPALVGERVAVRQCCLTLLSHLVSATEHGAIRVRFARRPRQVMVTITGSATGDLEQIGVGVAECRPFLEALQGRLEAEVPVAGSAAWTVQLSLPAYERPILLVVDNNADFVRLVERYMSGAAWEVIGAGTVDAAVALAQQRNPTVILLDVIIPGRDGWDLLLELRDEPATLAIPVIVCSVLHEPHMAITLGAAAYLQKPISQEQLLAALQPYRFT